MKQRILLSLLLLLVTGCAYRGPANWAATGGSKADGTVLMWHKMDQAQYSDQQCLAEALRRCQSWGYGKAEPFGATVTKCNLANAFGCLDGDITRNYQCLDK